MAARDFQAAPAHPRDITITNARLLGDWFGLLPHLADQGVVPTLTWVSDMVGNPIGGLRQGFTESENLGLNIAVDLDKFAGWKGATFTVSLSQRSGSSLTKNYIGNQFNVQQVFGGETFRLVNLNVRQELLDGNLVVQLGRMPAGDNFLTSPYYWVFVQNGIDGNPVGIFLNAPGMTAYPTATWGARVLVRPTERTYLNFGFFNGDPTLGLNENHGADFSFRGPLFFVAEAVWQRNMIQGDAGLPGNYKLGVYYNDGPFQDLASKVLGPAAPAFNVTANPRNGNAGVYALVDQGVLRFGEEGSRRGLGLFGAFLFAPDEEYNTMPFFMNGGMAFRGPFAARPTDFGGIAVIYGRYSGDQRAAQRQLQTVNPSVGVQTHEVALEANYAFRIRDGRVIFQPDVQYIIRPSGTGLIPNALVLGFQLALNF